MSQESEASRERVEVCALCGCKDFYDLFSQTDFICKTTQEVFPHARCVACGLMFLRERPEESAMERYFPEPPREGRSVGAETLKDFLKHFLYSAFAPEVSKALRFPLLPVGIAARRLGWLNALRNYRKPSFLPAPRTRLLDVGCGSGTTMHPFGRRYSMRWMKSQGVEAEGVELDVHACAEAQAAGLKVIQGDFLKTDFPEEAYDTVRFNQSLEYSRDPAAWLERARFLLKPGGTLVVSSPNYDGLSYELFPSAVDAPRRLFYFNPSCLTRHLKARGFRDVVVTTPPTPEILWFILKAFAPESLKDLTPGEEVLDLLPVCRVAASLGRGDDLDLVAQRSSAA